jgi:hypothetical protein
MSNQNYANQGTLAPELEQCVQSELSAGERLVWVGQPRPDMYRGSSVFLMIFGACFTTFALIFFLVGGGMALMFGVFGAAAAGNGAGGFAACFPLLFCLLSLPFLAVGVYMLTASIWMPKRIRRIIYALTDRRAVILEPNFFRKGWSVRSYSRDGLGNMYRVDKAHGAGDLVFEEYYTRSTNSQGFSSTHRNQRGFIAIDQVRDVEELVRLTLQL